MSVAKLIAVKAARKPQGKCEKCGKEINVGDPYRHFTVGFRSKRKRVRCIEVACTPRPSERESSAKAGPMSVMESFYDSYYSNVEDLQLAYGEVRDAFEEYASECEEALYAWENGNSQLEERAEAAREAADMLDNWEPEEFMGDTDPEGRPSGDEEFKAHMQEQREEAEALIEQAEGTWV